MAYFVCASGVYSSPKIRAIPAEQVRYERMREQVYSEACAAYGPHGLTAGTSRRDAGPYSPNERVSHFSTGWKFPNYAQPLRDEALTIPKRMKDFIDTSFGYAVSDKLRAAILAFEPDTHQFLPFEFFHRHGARLERRWLFNVCSRLDTIDVDQSSDNIVDFGDTIWRNSGAYDIAMRAADVSSRSFWFEWRYVHASLCVSDAFWRVIKRERITGVSQCFPRDHIKEV